MPTTQTECAFHSTENSKANVNREMIQIQIRYVNLVIIKQIVRLDIKLHAEIKKSKLEKETHFRVHVPLKSWRVRSQIAKKHTHIYVKLIRSTQKPI